MPGARLSPFQYATLRVVPRIERGECLNAGVILFARTLEFLGVVVALDEERLRALDPDADPGPIAAQLRGLARIGEGDPSAGPIARLTQPQRFHWLVAPASTAIQPSEVHTGLCEDPERMLEHLVARLVL